MGREFKKGDEVKVIAGSYNITKIGTKWVVSKDADGDSCWIGRSSTDQRFLLPIEHLALDRKTLDNLEVSYVVEKTKDARLSNPYSWAIMSECDSIGDKRTLLAVLSPGVYAMSKTSAQDEFGQIMTAKDLEKKGYTVQGAEPEQVHMDVAEIEQKIGLQAGALRIKKG